MKKSFLSFFHCALASLFVAGAAFAANESVTYTVFLPRYYQDGLLVAGDPSFISGTRGSFTTPAIAQYTCNDSVPSGYYVSKWLLSSSWGAGLSGKTISTQEGGTSFAIRFEEKWAQTYGTALDLTVYLSPITYTLAYDANGGTWTAGAPVGGTHKYLDAVTTPPASCAARENYDLTGWKSSGGQAFAAGAGFTGKELGITKNGQSATLYAQWKGKTFAVTLDTDGGTVATPLTSYTYGVGATLPKATKADSSFEGWYDNPTFTGNPVTSISKTDSGDKTFYAKFEQNVFSVTLNKDGGTVAKGADVTSYVYGKGATLPTLTKADCIFEGWYDDPGFSGDAVTKISADDYGDKEFWAKFSTGVFEVTLEKNGGTCTDLTSYTYGVGATLPKATKANCTFDGWYDNPNFLGDPVAKIGKDERGDKTFYAKFTQKDTVVHYNGNGATSGTMSDTSFAYGKTTALRENRFERTFTVTYIDGKDTVGTGTAEFTFTGWNDKPNGSGYYTYYDKQDVTNPCGSTGDPVTLYAMWNSATVTLPTPTGSGDFEGWYTAGGIRVGGAGEDFEPSNTITLYACWKGEKTYTIHFSPNADVVNSGAVPNRTSVKSGAAIGKLPDGNVFNNLASTGFEGWEYNGTLVNEEFSYTPINNDETVLLKARWKGCGDLSEAVGLNNAVLTTKGNWTVDKTNYYSDDKKTCVSCDKSGQKMVMSVKGLGSISFRHKGGALKFGYDGNVTNRVAYADSYSEKPVSVEVCGEGVHEIAFLTDGNTACYIDNLTWTPNDTTRKIQVSANPSGVGKAEVEGKSELKCKLGEKVWLTATGETFKHWSDGSTGDKHEVDVTCDETYQAIFSDGGGTETSHYYILFDGNGAANLGAMVGQSVDCDETVKLDENKFLRSGYKFLGWAKTRYDSVAHADQAYVKDLAAKDGTVKLYAVWEESASPQPEPGKTAVTVTITGTTKTVKYTGKKQTISGYTFKSDVAEYKASYCKFTGVAKVSGTEIGEYPMGLEEADFANKNDDYSVTFVVNDGLLVITGDDPGPGPTPEPGPYASTVGEAVEVDLAGDCAGYTIKSVSGLPAGLKYNKKTGLVTGTPTKAVSKENNVTITFADKTKAKTTWTVEALPKMMVGTYWGAATVGGVAGQFQLKLAATGKATGYFYAAGKKVTLKSAGLSCEGADCYAVAVSYTYDKTKRADEFVLSNAATVEGVDVWSAALAGASEALDGLDARRDTIKECFGKVVPKTTAYAVMEKTDEGEYLNAKVTTAGAVTVSGKLLNEAGKLTSVSCSTHLVVDDDGMPYCWITIYKAVGKSAPIVYEQRWELPE